MKNCGQDIIVVWQNNTKIYLKTEDICYFKADGCYTHIFTEDGKLYIKSKPIGEVEKEIDRDFMCRCHDSYLVNLNHIKSVDIDKRLIYQTLYQIPVSIRKMNHLIYKCNAYIQKNKFYNN